jgi:hypothetical protein
MYLQTILGDTFGMLTGKFNVHWMAHITGG